MSAVLSVSQINAYIKSLIDYDDNLKNIYICGEISNFTNHYRTGHFYFTLKDEKASMKAVMFRSAAERVRFEPENGMKVVIRGSISVFERDGIYQLYCEDMQPDGVGALNLAFEQLKNKLSALGMFSDEHKKPIPGMPSRVGVITSPTGAAIHDIITVLERRFPLAEVVFEGVAVQGDSAAPQIVEALKKFNRLKGADVIIVGRGGGSIEDLWAFNEESVAHAIFDSEIPVISAVGHETDFTIADFVSDMRAPTPSAAAEIAVPDYRDVLYSIDKLSDSLNESLANVFAEYKFKLKSIENVLNKFNPKSQLDSYAQNVAFIQYRLKESLSSKITEYEGIIGSVAMKLDALSPLRIISKGYCVAADVNEFPITSVIQLKPDDNVKLIFSDGKAICKVSEIKDELL